MTHTSHDENTRIAHIKVSKAFERCHLPCWQSYVHMHSRTRVLHVVAALVQLAACSRDIWASRGVSLAAGHLEEDGGIALGLVEDDVVALRAGQFRAAQTGSDRRIAVFKPLSKPRCRVSQDSLEQFGP